MLFGAVHSRTDAEVESDLKARLARSKLAPAGFQVRVRGGVATLTGNAAIVQHKGIATRMAKAAGASRVENHIQISAEGRKQALDRLKEGHTKAKDVKAPPVPVSSSLPPAFVPPPVRRARIQH